MEGGVTQHSKKVTIYDLMAIRHIKRVVLRHLRPKYLKICHQYNIDDQILEGTVEFDCKNPYKLHVSIKKRKLFTLGDFYEIHYMLMI